VNLATIIDEHPAASPALLTAEGDTLTYGALRDRVGRLRGGLAGAGLRQGDRIGLVLGNEWRFVVTYLAALGLGLVAVPLNPSSPRRELERELAVVGARAVVVGPTARAAVSELDRAALPELRTVIDTGVDNGAGDHLRLDDLLAAEAVPVVDVGPDDVAALLFTAGTAGSPKAAKLTHRNLSVNIEQLQASPQRAQGISDVVLGVLPLFHVFGLNVVLGLTLRAGAAVLLVERFDPVATLAAVGREGVTVIPGAPTMWAAWAALPDAPADAFASVRLAASGAAALGTEVAATMEDRYGLVVAEGYGLTEASPVVTSAAGLDRPPRGSVGAPVPGVEVRLVDADGDDALLGDEGEVWVRGPNVFAGYWDDEEASQAAVTPEGWLRTGDIGVVDDDGHLYLVDRAKDLIIVSGFNVYPAEVEEVLLEHPAVEAVAVVGIGDAHTGEAVKAFVVTAPGASATDEELVAFCRDRLARYKCPAAVVFVDTLPRGLGGKLIRRALR
jgi:long-chain acyl-CoA synthetase